MWDWIYDLINSLGGSLDDGLLDTSFDLSALDYLDSGIPGVESLGAIDDVLAGLDLGGLDNWDMMGDLGSLGDLGDLGDANAVNMNAADAIIGNAGPTSYDDFAMEQALTPGTTNAAAKYGAPTGSLAAGTGGLGGLLKSVAQGAASALGKAGESVASNVANVDIDPVSIPSVSAGTIPGQEPVNIPDAPEILPYTPYQGSAPSPESALKQVLGQALDAKGFDPFHRSRGRLAALLGGGA